MSRGRERGKRMGMKVNAWTLTPRAFHHLLSANAMFGMWCQENPRVRLAVSIGHEAPIGPQAPSGEARFGWELLQLGQSTLL